MTAATTPTRAHVHGLGFEECVVEIALNDDQRGGTFWYRSKHPAGYEPKVGATLNVVVWGGPTFNAEVTEVLPDGTDLAILFQRLST